MDSRYFGISDPDPYQSEELVPDPCQSQKQDPLPDPHQSQNSGSVEAKNGAMGNRRRSP